MEQHEAPISTHDMSGESYEWVYSLFKEATTPKPGVQFWERSIDVAINRAQPCPTMSHVELFVPPKREDHDVHFATYIGKRAGWGSRFDETYDYYLDPSNNGPTWRAVPVMARGAVSRVRNECEKHIDTPYGSPYMLFNYPFSCPPFRSLAWVLEDKALCNAHCATLTTRCLRRAIPELNIPHSSAWYGPSTLFLELTKKERMVSYRDHLSNTHSRTSFEKDEKSGLRSTTLLLGSDQDVCEMTPTECKDGIDLLCRRCVVASADGDSTMERLLQKNLARALLRYSHVARHTNS